VSPHLRAILGLVLDAIISGLWVSLLLFGPDAFVFGALLVTVWKLGSMLEEVYGDGTR